MSTSFKVIEESKLEKDILRWFINNADNEALKFQLEKKQIVKREYSGVGFYYYFEKNKSSEKTPRIALKQRTVDGPLIQSPKIPHEAKAVLFISDGIIQMIEVFTFDDPMPEILREYFLTTHSQAN